MMTNQLTPRLLSTVLTFALALWIGGLAWLFVTVSKLFALDREMAILIAPTFFTAFNRYQVVLGLIACAASAAIWLSNRRKSAAAPLACVMTAMIIVAGIFLVTRRLEVIRISGFSGGQEFKRLHGLSMLLYVGTAVLTAIALGTHSMVATPHRDHRHNDSSQGDE